MKPSLPIQDLSTPELLRLMCPRGSGADEAPRRPDFEALAAEFYRRKEAMRRQRETDYWRRWANAYFAEFKN